MSAPESLDDKARGETEGEAAVRRFRGETEGEAAVRRFTERYGSVTGWHAKGRTKWRNGAGALPDPEWEARAQAWDEMVERVAAAMWDRGANRGGTPWQDFAREGKWIADEYRRMAAAALKVIEAERAGEPEVEVKSEWGWEHEHPDRPGTRCVHEGSERYVRDLVARQRAAGLGPSWVVQRTPAGPWTPAPDRQADAKPTPGPGNGEPCQVYNGVPYDDQADCTTCGHVIDSHWDGRFYGAPGRFGCTECGSREPGPWGLAPTEGGA